MFGLLEAADILPVNVVSLSILGKPVSQNWHKEIDAGLSLCMIKLDPVRFSKVSAGLLPSIGIRMHQEQPGCMDEALPGPPMNMT